MTADPAPQPASEHATEPGRTTENPPADQPGAPAGAEVAPKSPREAELEAELAAFKDKALRALAEAENTRRRLSAEKDDALRYAAAGFAREIVPVADNLRRALDSIGAEARAQDKALDNLAVGVEMVERMLLAAFERSGIKPIEALGQRLDPHLHEVMFEIEDKTRPAGTVAQILETGYVIHDRLLRAAKVAVAKGGPAQTQGAPAPIPTSTPASTQDSAAYDKPAPETGTKLDEQL